MLEALSEDYASQVRDAIQEALRLDPDMAAAHLSLAAWHAGAVSAGGFLAGLLYGANEEDALAQFERALELAPQEKIVLLEYALGLLSLDTDDNHGKARDLLDRAIKLPSERRPRPDHSPEGGRAAGGSRRRITRLCSQRDGGKKAPWDGAGI